MTASVLWLCLALLAGHAAAFAPTPWLSSRAVASVSTRSAEAVVMKKGRSQGSGPKIALKKKKTKTEGQAAMEKRMSDFARRASKKKKPTIIINIGMAGSGKTSMLHRLFVHL